MNPLKSVVVAWTLTGLAVSFILVLVFLGQPSSDRHYHRPHSSFAK